MVKERSGEVVNERSGEKVEKKKPRRGVIWVEGAIWVESTTWVAKFFIDHPVSTTLNNHHRISTSSHFQND